MMASSAVDTLENEHTAPAPAPASAASADADAEVTSEEEEDEEADDTEEDAEDEQRMTPESAKRDYEALQSNDPKSKQIVPAPARRWTKAEDDTLARAVDENQVSDIAQFNCIRFSVYFHSVPNSAQHTY
jgi:hypothetical protein